MEQNYTVRGIFNDLGMFRGAIFNNGKKFGSVSRVNPDVINCSCSTNKEIQFKEYKDWLKKNRLTQFKFLSEQIDLYIMENIQDVMEEN